MTKKDLQASMKARDEKILSDYRKANERHVHNPSHPCSCYIDFSETKGSRIVYCPTHAAAPEMRGHVDSSWGEAQEAIRFIRERKPDQAITVLEATIRSARALLAKIEKGA
jgi:hypothetical protein